MVTASVLSHVHKLLADYFLRQGSLGRGLDHFSELVACTTNEVSTRLTHPRPTQKIFSSERFSPRLVHSSQFSANLQCRFSLYILH